MIGTKVKISLYSFTAEEQRVSTPALQLAAVGSHRCSFAWSWSQLNFLLTEMSLSMSITALSVAPRLPVLSVQVSGSPLLYLVCFLSHLHSLQINRSPVSLVEGVITLGISFISTSVVPQHFAECGHINVISVEIWTRLAVVNNWAQSSRLSLRWTMQQSC